MTRTPDLLDALGGHLGVEAPGGMVLGWRSTRSDLRSQNGYRWPWPGGWAEAPDDGRDLTDAHPTEACPSETLGGLCLAKSWLGARSGGIPAHMALVVAYRPGDVLGQDDDKMRVRRCLVVDVVDVAEHIRQGRAAMANLTGAYLAGADLTRANLAGAYLAGAYLAGAYLARADLARAYLTRANLTRANLTRANLAGANLAGAYLAGADLAMANLTGANLTGADLAGANLAGTDLTRADLAGANLAGANLAGTYLAGAYRSLGDPPITGWTVRDGRLVSA